jgi:1-acyl-sn-glycerol-3-phosphate acyltransferase
MKWIRGYYRLCLAALTLGLGGTLIVLTAWIPVEVKGFRLSFWILVQLARSLLFVFNVKVTCPDKDAFRAHHGFVFPNHVSYLDALVLLSVAPVRFVAKDEVRAWLIVGWIARAIGCVFVKRDDKKSRADARAALALVDTFPPVALFPEGKRGPGDALLPFRYGAFEIVVQGNAAYLPCVITYKPLEIAIWRRDEHFVKALWRLSTFAGPVRSKLAPMQPVSPGVDGDPVQISVGARTAMQAAFETQSGEGASDE